MWFSPRIRDLGDVAVTPEWEVQCHGHLGTCEFRMLRGGRAPAGAAVPRVWRRFLPILRSGGSAVELGDHLAAEEQDQRGGFQRQQHDDDGG
jgi:hypothetical protein